MLPDKDDKKPQDTQGPAIEHITGAHARLKTLRERVGEHPELTEAIRDLEMALSILTVKTSGLL